MAPAIMDVGALTSTANVLIMIGVIAAKPPITNAHKHATERRAISGSMSETTHARTWKQNGDAIVMAAHAAKQTATANNAPAKLTSSATDIAMMAAEGSASISIVPDTTTTEETATIPPPLPRRGRLRPN